MMRSLCPMASLSLFTALFMSFIKNGSHNSLSCGRKKRFASLSVVMPLLMSRPASIGLVPNNLPNSSAAFVCSDVGGS